MTQSPETCRRYGQSCARAGCFLLNLLHSQAGSGGNTAEGKPAGPMWQTPVWNALVERIITDANDPADPCPLGKEVAIVALRLTVEKVDNGTLQSPP